MDIKSESSSLSPSLHPFLLFHLFVYSASIYQKPPVCPGALGGLGVRAGDRSVTSAAGRRCCGGRGHQAGWEKPGLLACPFHAGVLYCLAFSSPCSLLACLVLAETSSLPGIAWEPVSSMLAAVRNWAGAWLSRTHLVPVSCVQAARCSCRCSKLAARPHTLPECVWVLACPCAFCSTRPLDHSRLSAAAFYKTSLLLPTI